MNFYKLAFQNIKQMIGHYYLYFLSLSLLAAFYYIFTAMSQTIHLEMIGITGLSGTEFLLFGNFFMYIFAFTFIFFTNRFFLKRRWNEIGIYRFLGIKRRQIILLFVLEAVLLLCSALILGCVLGILLSKLFAMILLKMVGSTQSTTILWSLTAMIQTGKMFGYAGIFLIIYDMWYLYRHRLVDLLKKNHQAAHKNQWKFMDFLGSVISIYCLLFGYMQANKYANEYRYYFTDVQTIDMTRLVFGSFMVLFSVMIGTFFFFYSLLPFILIGFSKWRKFYYQKLRMFTIDRLVAYLRSYGVVLSVASILCGFSFAILSGAVLLIGSFDQYGKTQLNYNYIISDDYYSQFEQLREKAGFQVADKQKIPFKILPAQIKITTDKKLTTPVNIISIEMYQKIHQAKVDEKTPFLLTQGGFEIAKEEIDLQLANQQGNYYKVKVENNWGNLFNAAYSTPYLLVVSSDEFSKIIAPNYQLHFVNLVQDELSHPDMKSFDVELDRQDQVVSQLTFSVQTKGKQLFSTDEFHSKQDPVLKEETDQYFILSQKNISIQNLNVNTFRIIFGTLLFVAIFLGLLFLAASGSLIMVKQLSTIDEERRDYQVLQYMGVSKGMLKRSIYIQNVALFLLPMILSLLDCYFALKMYHIFVAFGSVKPVIILLFVIVCFYSLFQFGTMKRYLSTVFG